MKRAFVAVAAALIAVSHQASAQAISAGCTGVNALGSQNIALGVPTTFGPFNGFDEGFANQPSDGDTIRLGIGGRDMNVTVEYIGTGTTTATMAPGNTFSNLIIGGSANHPEAGSLSIRLTMTGGTDPTPSVFIQCLGTPNPGQPAAVGAAVTTPEATAVSEEITVSLAEESVRLPTTPADLPSILTTPAPQSNAPPSDADLQDVNRAISAALEAAMRGGFEDFEDEISVALDGSGLTNVQLAQIAEIVQDRLPGFAVEINRTYRDDFGEPIDSAAGRTPEQIEGDRRRALQFRTGTNGSARQRLETSLRTTFGLTQEQVEALDQVIDNEILRFAGSANSALAGAFAALPGSITDDNNSEIYADIEKALDLLEANPRNSVPQAQINRWRRSALRAFVEGFDGPNDEGVSLTEGPTVLFAGRNGNTATFFIDTNLLRRLDHAGFPRLSSMGGPEVLPYNVWARGRVSLMDGRADGVDGAAFEIQVGAIRRLSRHSEIGAFVSAFQSETTAVTSRTKYSTNARNFGLYGNHQPRDGILLGMSIVGEVGDTSTNAAGVTANYGYRQNAVSLSLSGSRPWGDWMLAPSLSYSLTRRDTEAHVTSSGTAVAAHQTMTRALTSALGGSTSREVRSKALSRIDARWRAAATYYNRANTTVTSPLAQSAGLSIGGGMTFHYDSGGALSLDTTIGGLGQDTISLGLNVRYALDF